MSLAPFTVSEPLTLGVELELQIVNRHDYDLSPSARDLLRLMARHQVPGQVTPEITGSRREGAADRGKDRLLRKRGLRKRTVTEESN